MSYLGKILIAIDQLGNSIANGNPDCTISGRTGYYANHAIQQTAWYWEMLQSIINFTFYPLDGPDHCHYAYHKEENEDYQPAKGIVIMFILSLITIVSCIILIPFLYMLLGVGLLTPKIGVMYRDQEKQQENKK